jgi:methionine-rich copper-binding protein CopC
MNKLTRAITIALFAVFSAVSPTPSFAHDELVSSSPAAGSTVEAGDIPIAIEFGEALMESTDNAGTEILIVDDTTNEVLPVDCISVEGNHIYATAGLYVEGPVTLTWRTVAEDGHPISESFGFTVTNPEGLTPGEGSLCGIERSNVLVDKEPVATSTGPDNALIGLGIGIALIVGFSILGALKIKRREDKEDRYR